jgi:hypothetical protein
LLSLGLDLLDLLLNLSNLLLEGGYLLAYGEQFALCQLAALKQFQGFGHQIMALLIGFHREIIRNIMQVLDLGEPGCLLRSFLYAMLYGFQKTH